MPGRPSRRKNEPGDLADRVHPLLDVHREREEVEVLGPLDAAVTAHGVVIQVGDDGSGGLAREAPGLEPDGARAVVVDDDGSYVFGLVIFSWRTTSSAALHGPGWPRCWPRCR